MNIKTKAFTLIELLVTIVIIGILATISVATFRNYQGDAENVQRLTVVTQYLDALHRMNASGESFPSTIGKSSGSYPDIACLIYADSGLCWNNSIKFVPEIQAKFDKHLQGIKEMQLSLKGRDGLIYVYPISHPSHKTAAINLGLNPDKTATMQWLMDTPNYPCNKIKNASIRHANYAGKEKTYCQVYIEDIN